MEQFWSQTRNSPRDTSNGDQELVAFVLPKDYGWGMRNVADNIWGLWPADEKASLIWENMNRLIDKYGI
jgi:hypothetical protein